MDNNRKADCVFISWAPFCSRSDSIIRRLGGSSYMVYSPFWGSHPVTILFKYASQTLKTFAILLKKRPRCVFVMTPPVIACFAVWLYCRLTRSSYIIDAHSGAFLDRRWQPILFLHRFFSRRAQTTIVTNRYLHDMVCSWGARSTIVSDVPICFAHPTPVVLSSSFNVTLINTFTKDEPLETFLEAAVNLPEVQFYVTGPLREANRLIVASAPANVQFTGFLPDSEYVGLLLASSAVMCLTTLEHTMQRGAYEAVYLEKPVITSNTEFLRAAFDKGTVHVETSVDGIVRGVREMKEHLQVYEEQVKSLRVEKLEQWNRAEALLRGLSSGDGQEISLAATCN